MVATSAARVVVWSAGAVVAGSAFGMGWAGQEVSVPLWGLLVLTFVPTSDLIETTRLMLDSVAEKVAGRKPPDGPEASSVSEVPDHDPCCSEGRPDDQK